MKVECVPSNFSNLNLGTESKLVMYTSVANEER